MDLLPDADQQALGEATRDYIQSRFPLADGVMQLDDVRWKEISDLGWVGLAAPEDAGGGGATLVDEAILFQELGRGLVIGPILTTLAAARLACWTDNMLLASDLIGGASRVSRAIRSPADGDRLLIVDAEGADLTLLLDDNAVGIFPSPDHVSFNPGIEDGTQIGHIGASELRSPRLFTENATTVARLRRLVSILTAAQLAGICSAATEQATEHAKTRIQFGKPIGAFQAIKHMCADMATNALAAESLTYFAALTEQSSGSDSDYHSLAAAAFCRRAAFANTRINIQVHGAMGFTVEHSAHRFLKRVHSLSAVESFDQASVRLKRLPAAEIGDVL